MFDCLTNCKERWQPKPRQLGKREPRSKNNHSSNQLHMASDCHVLHTSDCPSCQILQKIRWSLLRVSRRRAERWRRPPTSSQSRQQLFNLGQYYLSPSTSSQKNIFNGIITEFSAALQLWAERSRWSLSPIHLCQHHHCDIILEVLITQVPSDTDSDFSREELHHYLPSSPR